MIEITLDMNPLYTSRDDLVEIVVQLRQRFEGAKLVMEPGGGWRYVEGIRAVFE